MRIWFIYNCGGGGGGGGQQSNQISFFVLISKWGTLSSVQFASKDSLSSKAPELEY